MNQLIRDALCNMGHADAVIFDCPDFIEYNTMRALEYMNLPDAREKPPIVMNRLHLEEDDHGTH